MSEIDALKGEIKKLSAKAMQAKMDLHDLSEELPVNWTSILTVAQKAHDASPDNPAIADTLGWIHYKKGLYRSSVRHLETATKNAQTATPVRLFHLAMAYAKAGDKNKAAAAYKRGVEVAQTAKLKMPPEADEARKVLGI